MEFEASDVWLAPVVQLVDVARPHTRRVYCVDLGERDQDDAESGRVEPVVEVVEGCVAIEHARQKGAKEGHESTQAHEDAQPVKLIQVPVL